MPGIFFGYPAQAWQAAYAAISYLNGILQTGNPIAVMPQIESTFATCRNAINAVQSWEARNVLIGEYTSLREVESLSLGLQPTDQTFLVNRVNAVQNLIAAYGNYIPTIQPLRAQAAIAQGQPAIVYPGTLEGLVGSTIEIAPPNLTALTLVLSARQEAQSWFNIKNAVALVQGNVLTGAYDAASRMQAVALACYGTLNSFRSTIPFAFDQNQVAGASDPVTLWNQSVTIPSLLTLAAVVSSPPNTRLNQECGVIRYALGTIADQLALLLLTLRKPAINTINLAEVRSGDSLMDLAARNLGDFEQWSAIAALNGLSPPWVGGAASTTAAYGSEILLPSAGSSAAIAAGSPVLSYEVNVLGTDLNFGPLNGPMLPWSGDFEVISGYSNLSLALGRRLQTPLGDLVYHGDYGSRIPPEVGAVQDQYDAKRLEVYAVSALMSDGRVADINSVSVTGFANSGVQVVGLVQPVGYGATSAAVNATIGASPF